MKEDSTIVLSDIFRFFKQQRRIIFGFFSVGILVASIYYYFTPPLYESRAVIQIGQIGQIGQIEAAPVVVARLKGQGLGKERTVVVEIPRNGPQNLITITLRDSNEEKAKELLERVGSLILAEHQQVYSKRVEKLHTTLQWLKQTDSMLTSDVLGLKEISTGATKDASLDLLLKLEKRKIIDSQIVLKQQIEAQENLLSEANTFSTRWISEPSLGKQKVSPKIKIAGTIGATGLFVGIIVAFYRLQRMKIQKQ